MGYHSGVQCLAMSMFPQNCIICNAIDLAASNNSHSVCSCLLSFLCYFYLVLAVHVLVILCGNIISDMLVVYVGLDCDG